VSDPFRTAKRVLPAKMKKSEILKLGFVNEIEEEKGFYLREIEESS